MSLESKFALINTTQTTLGQSTLIQYLHGKKVHADYVYAPKNGSELYSKEELEIIAKEVADKRVVGLSSFSICEERAFQLARYLKGNSPNQHIILGGPNCIMDPERIVQTEGVDSVCTHEGEIPLFNLLKTDAQDRSTKGIWFKEKGRIIKNSYETPIQTLDEIPFENYKKSTFGSFRILTPAGWRMETNLSERINNPCMQGRILYVMGSRGCPYSCSYCINDTLKGINKQTHTKPIRKKTNSILVEEIERTVKTEEGIERIFFFDDDFFVRDEREIEDFVRQYSSRVRKPFMIFANPLSITERKLDLASQAGLETMELGLQTVSDSVLQKYRRPQMQEQVRRILQHVKNKPLPVNVSIDFITNSPLENRSDVLQNINYILNLPGDFTIYAHNLHLFPGSALRREFGKATGNESSEYQNYNDLLAHQTFNEYETKILLAMQGRHKAANPALFGTLTREEIANLLATKDTRLRENIALLNKRIAQTEAAQFYKQLV